MKKIILLLTLITFNLKAQTIIVNYSENAMISKESKEQMSEFENKNAQKKEEYILKYSNGISVYQNKNAFVANTVTFTEKQSDSISMNKNETIYKISEKNKEKYYYKDYEKKTLYFEGYFTETISYCLDSIQNFNWTITEDVKDIDGYKCKKATSNWKEINFIAWFTEEIPTSIGPEKFCGLPGLILYISSPYFEWKALSINTISEKTEFAKPDLKNKKTLTLVELNNSIENKIKSFRPSTTIKQEGNTTIKTERIIIK